MNTGINTRLAVLDALGWPIGIALWLIVQSDFQIGGAHGMAFLFLGIWAMRKLGWALDGYRDEVWAVSMNPIVLALGLLLRQEGWYSYTTTTVLLWGGSVFALACVAKLVT
ncbi:hypothetical protein [Azohydromonas australica]|uniref:hypothetical protein n=1 Tax=Azohydromonas australica TaxID=364039 RepID=UPI0004284D9C|nr:hypothetical protein [Azohydromonas australica]